MTDYKKPEPKIAAAVGHASKYRGEEAEDEQRAAAKWTEQRVAAGLPLDTKEAFRSKLAAIRKAMGALRGGMRKGRKLANDAKRAEADARKAPWLQKYRELDTSLSMAKRYDLVADRFGVSVNAVRKFIKRMTK
jgi:hypothetical protein